MRKIEYHSSFKKDYKKAVKRGYDISKLIEVIELLAIGNELPQRYKDHELQGAYKDYRECHITSDWLLIYQISDDSLVLCLTRTGTHSDLF